MAQSTIPGSGTTGRRLTWPVAVAVAGSLLAIAVVWGAATLSSVGTAATASPAPASEAPASEAVVAPTPTAVPPTAPPTIAPPTAPPPTPIPTPATVAAPLTGLLVSPAAALQHPIAVMIDDDSRARPQSGFNSAAIVWHAPAEGGVPRYMMIFQDEIPPGVGPVRSSRQYFIEWASEWRAMYVHHGGSPQALATLRAKGAGQWVYNADGFRWSGRYLWRTDDRRAPHNVYTDGEHLRALAERIHADDGPLTPIWSFKPDVNRVLRPVGGTLTVTYPYETITYRYDAATNWYVRYINKSSTPQIDRNDGQIVAPANVVILKMAFGPLNDGHPKKHRLEAQDVGKGQAWVATNGRTIKGTWKKKSPTAPTLLYDLDGKRITLTAGQTFVQVLPLSSTFNFKFTTGKTPAWQPPPQAPAVEPL